jgi:hypothetical protein
MNPYNDAVTNRIGELGTRNLTENLLPAIEGRYIQAGQLGYGGRGGLGGTPSGMMTDTARTLRDVNADILAQQTAALGRVTRRPQGLPEPTSPAVATRPDGGEPRHAATGCLGAGRCADGRLVRRTAR